MARKTLSIVDYFTLDSPAATEFRRLLYRIKKRNSGHEMKSLLVTSSVLSEGKSTVCSFLGMTAAAKETKTLLVDCDLRRPTLHKHFNVPREMGMSELLVDRLAARSVIKKTVMTNLDIITAGRPDAHPGDIFEAPAIGAVIEDLKYFYDLIVIDAPPVIPVSDPMLLSAEVDGVLLVVKTGSTQREVVRRAGAILASNRQKIVGLVMNDVGESLPYYYKYQSYGYQYQTRPPERKQSRSPGKSDHPQQSKDADTGAQGSSSGKRSISNR
jgi:capsular exopolysaccharide synthesis family protein